MTLSNRYRREIVLLAEAFFEGTLDDTQAERLDDLVSQDREAAQFYMEYVETHAELYHAHKGQTPTPPSDSLMNDVLGDTPTSPLCPEEKSEPSTDMNLGDFTLGGWFLSWGGLGALTLLIAISSATAFLWTSRQTTQSPVSSVALNQESKENGVATLTAVLDWDGKANAATFETGSPLKLGDHLHVPQGTVEVTYNTGAKVCIRGPASYAISNVNRGLLEEGEVSVYVPEEAIGFIVDTPAGQVIDQGTEFDIKVQKDLEGGVATADVQVIKGAVDIAIPENVKEEAVCKRFEVGEAVRLSSMQHVESSEKAATSNDPFDPRTIKNLRLWLCANVAVMLDKHGGVTEMIDVVGGPNQKAENFRQSEEGKRPRWLESGLNGRAMLTFSKRQYLQLAEKTDLCFNDESLTIFVVGKATDHTQYFLSSLGTHDESVTKGFRFTTSLDCGLRYMAGKSVKVVRECPIARHNVLSVVHDRRSPGKNTVALFCNGRQLGRVEPVENVNLENAYPLTVGANPEVLEILPYSSQNYLQGDIAELLIYDRVLTELEKQRIESYLMVQYGIKAIALEVK